MNENQSSSNTSVLTFDEFLFIFRKSVTGMIISAILAGIAVLAVLIFLIPKTYSATAQLYVITSSDTVINLSDLQAGASLTSDYIQLMKRPDFLSSVISELQLESLYVYEDLRNMIDIINPSDTRILNVKVNGSDPQIVADIANTVANQSIAEISEIMETSRLKFTQKATPPTYPSAPNMTLYVMVAAFIGAFLFFTYSLFSHIADDTVKNAEMLNSKLNIAVLGLIYKEPDKDSDIYGNEYKN